MATKVFGLGEVLLQMAMAFSSFWKKSKLSLFFAEGAVPLRPQLKNGP